MADNSVNEEYQQDGAEVACGNESCDETVEVAFWEDAVLSGKYIPFCDECNDERPEYNLWDASAFGEDAGGGPNERDGHPIPDGYDWVVQFVGADLPSHGDEDGVSVDAVEIFIRDPSDEDSLAAARAEAEDMLHG